MKNITKIVFASILSIVAFMPLQTTAQQESADNVSTESKICARYGKFVLVAAEFKSQGVSIASLVDEINRQKANDPAEAALLREIAFETYKRIPLMSNKDRMDAFVLDLANRVYIDCYTQLSASVE